MTDTTELERLARASAGGEEWKKWGPYLSERQWGTVREDYSDNGDAWNYFTHDQARSRAYRWGEDGLAGLSDRNQILCFSLALWNGVDPIIKERLFGLSNQEGNHGEDVKECYFYLDSTPTHSYMKYLYKYPQNPFPYEDLVKINRTRSREEPEYELLDTGVFKDNRYFDVFVEYAKLEPEEIFIKISIWNRGDKDSILHVLPTLLFRNTWSWSDGGSKPELKRLSGLPDSVVHAHHTDALFRESLSDCYLYCQGNVPLLFCDNETNNARLFGAPNNSHHPKDAINDYLVKQQTAAVNEAGVGSKAAAHYELTVPAGACKTVCLRLSTRAPEDLPKPFAVFDKVLSDRKRDADEFYEAILTPALKDSPDLSNIFRQAMAGMLWSKQYFYYDVNQWLKEHGSGFLDMQARNKGTVRNQEWYHMYNADIISMPDKWEYPWYAAWDLAFHTIPLSTVDLDFAKEQLDLMLRNSYQHPNGQLPAYEWNFGDVNPPTHAFATFEVYRHDKERHNGKGDIDFLKYAFSKLMVNYSWWINRKDPHGKNVFDGGFLGLDNIGVFDRSSPLPTGGSLEQADGTAWMVFFSQQMLAIAIELSLHDPLYEDFAVKFLQHTLFIAGAMDRIGEHQDELWDEEDGFFYDVLRLPGGNSQRLKVRSMVGLLPMCATTILEAHDLERLPNFTRLGRLFTDRHPELCHNIHLPWQAGVAGRHMLAIVDERKLRRILNRLLDENEFLSPYGIRSLSRYHHEHPFVFNHAGSEFKVSYLPGESNTGMFGGNSNWRGPIWMPVNYLLLRALLRAHSFYGKDFKVECPTNSGNQMSLFEVAREISNRLTAMFTKGPDGGRPLSGGNDLYRTDPHWQDLVLFYEYFNGDNGEGIGSSHQTGWTGLIARIIRINSFITEDMLLSADGWELSNQALMAHYKKESIAL
jgi:hypothetical protein